MSLLLKECRWCGVSFVPTHFNELYCSGKCRDERYKEKYMENNKKRKKLPVCYRKTKKLLDGTPTIPDVVAATIEHKEKTGRLISYGKMVAIIERGVD